MKSAFRVSYYSGLRKQGLRNVAILAPSIFWVKSGSKRLFFHDSTLDITSKSLLLSHSQHKLTFDNLPEQGRFYSLQLSLLIPPSQEMLNLSAEQSDNSRSPIFTPNEAILNTLSLLAALDLTSLSITTQQYWLYALYQQLAEAGKLQLLFPQQTNSFMHQLSEYLSARPSQRVQLDDVCHHFAVSRATLNRRLKRENTQFRDLLTQVRMNHALGLLQQGVHKQLDLALMCGYQSPERFSQRFNQQFGITLKQYIKTLTH